MQMESCIKVTQKVTCGFRTFSELHKSCVKVAKLRKGYVKVVKLHKSYVKVAKLHKSYVKVAKFTTLHLFTQLCCNFATVT